MEPTDQTKTNSILLALLVTFLWATSWVLIKWGLSDISPLIFAGIRYFLAFLCLLPFILTKSRREEITKLRGRDWLLLLLLGVLYYALTQGAQFAGLAVLPAMSVSLILSFTSLFVAALGIKTLGEKPSKLQWVGLALNILGACLYFYPVRFPREQWLAVGIVFLGMLGNSVSMVIGRKINRDIHLAPINVTTISMGFGSILLLAAGIIMEAPPKLEFNNWVLIVWLAVVNTALAFTWWNKALQKLEAMEASIINNTIMVQIAVLAWVVLGERMDSLEILGVTLAASGAVLVQLRRKPEAKEIQTEETIA
jgi:drug/metabolite transporter (DMT)-like permease